MINIIKTNDLTTIKKILKKFNLPKSNSHKGQNGKVLIIGGSSLFHAASLWAAEIASYFADIIHYCSTKENEKIFLNLKTKFRNGIVVSQKNLLDYVKEDDVILVGPGMVRKLKVKSQKLKIDIEKIFSLKDEGEYTYYLTKFLIENFPEKKFVFDAGTLQMMDKDWLLKLKMPAIITPHQKEFEGLFVEKITDLNLDAKIDVVENYAKKYNTVILLKSIKDIVSDGKNTYIVEGGNAGLTKGGTGDILAGLVLSFYAKNEPIVAAVLSSYLIKKSADDLFKQFGYWYNIDRLMEKIPETLNNLYSHDL